MRLFLRGMLILALAATGLFMTLVVGVVTVMVAHDAPVHAIGCAVLTTLTWVLFGHSIIRPANAREWVVRVVAACGWPAFFVSSIIFVPFGTMTCDESHGHRIVNTECSGDGLIYALPLLIAAFINPVLCLVPLSGRKERNQQS